LARKANVRFPPIPDVHGVSIPGRWISDRLFQPDGFPGASARGALNRAMPKALQSIHPIFFLIVATTMEVMGDAMVRKAIYEPYQGVARAGLVALGAALLLGYGTALNLAPVPFARVAGLYIATLFVVWQIITFLVFRSLPTAPILVGGALIVTGGLVVTFWRAA
jgi:small multidrug resistance family-3 protein